MQLDSLKYVRDRFNLPINDEQLEELPFYRPAENSPELKYMKARREVLGGYLPARRKTAPPLPIPELSIFDAVLKGSGEKAAIHHHADGAPDLGIVERKGHQDHVVPIVPDEARTFGLEDVPSTGIYAAHGQKYPEDNEQLMNYREAKDGHMLQEGINEAGAMSAWAALGTSYSTNNLPMIPMYMYYPCLVSSALATLHGQQAMHRHRVSCLARLLAVPHTER